MSRRTIFVVVAIACAVAFWLRGSHRGAHNEVAAAPAGSGSTVASPPAAPPALPVPAAKRPTTARAAGTVEIKGTVIDASDGSPVGGVEVVVRGPLGEASISAGNDGSFAVDVSPGTYRAFVRSD